MKSKQHQTNFSQDYFAENSFKENMQHRKYNVGALYWEKLGKMISLHMHCWYSYICNKKKLPSDYNNFYFYEQRKTLKNCFVT